MAKYDKFFNSQKTIKEELTPEDAVTAIAVVTAAAESSLDEVDADTIADLLWDFEFFEELSEDDLYDAVDRLLAVADESGVGALFSSAKALLTGDLLLDGFASGVLMLVDEDELIIPKGRQALLKRLQEALGIEDSDAQEVIDEVIEAFNEAETLDLEEEEEEGEAHQN
ncbi:MAG: hypothetical protein KME64_19405 [Scytonematopsis contorta HA4267-MV1]|jgi:hypothetical protein|nr:hypothetical protein [Scytonematopsis contorta HA4267-MV1]